MKLLSLLILLGFSSCVSNTSLIQDGSVYLFQGKEQVIISFTHQPSKKLLSNTGEIISFLKKQLPFSIKDESILIEGLSDDIFFNFFLIGDRLFFSTDQLKNKTLIYAYIASLYQEFHQKTSPFIAISEFENFIQNKKITAKENEILLKATVDFAVKDIYFVSILELLERPRRYFFPQKAKDELFRVLIYPEITTFWNYLSFRFGKQNLFEFAQYEYNKTAWQNNFGEEIHDTESAFVKTLDNIKQTSSILNDDKNYQTFTNSLQLYMSGTKKSLMKE